MSLKKVRWQNLKAEQASDKEQSMDMAQVASKQPGKKQK